MKDFSKENIFISSDFHLGHRNITLSTSWKNEFGEIPLEQVRHFKDENEMTEQLIENINKTVPSDALLIHLGDWSFGGLENIYNFRKQIKCNRIINVRGNHDHHIGEGKKFYIDKEDFNIDYPFDFMECEVDWSFHSIHDILKFKYKKYNFECSHMPFLIWTNMTKGWMNLHGHIHSKGDSRFLSYNQMDVGIDGNMDFRPYSIEEVIAEIQKSNLTKTKNLDRHSL